MNQKKNLRVEKALKSFYDVFDEHDLSKANEELDNLLVVANLDPSEKAQFLGTIVNDLHRRNIVLDYTRKR